MASSIFGKKLPVTTNWSVLPIFTIKIVIIHT